MKNLKKSLLVAVFIATLAPSVTLSKIHQNSRQQKSLSFNIQVPVHIPEEASMQNTLSALVNKIVKEELGLKANCSVNFFRRQERPHISIYFVGEINTENKGKDVIYDAIKSIFLQEETFTFDQVYFSQKIDIFGFKKNTLVMLVEDAVG